MHTSSRPDMRPVYPKAGSYPDFAQLVKADGMQVDRRVFVDEQVYQAELRQVFGRAWLFLAHESQIPNAGDFVRTYMGEDDVIVVRQRDESISAFLNSCPHRGNRVCPLDSGQKARGFICNYHGWSFGIDGKLRGTDGNIYESDPSFEQSHVRLTPVAQVQSYKGLVFGTFDPAAPPLPEFLGPFTFYLDAVLDTDAEGTEFIGGSIKSTMECNWKLPAENFAGDVLHAFWTHQSGAQAILGGPVNLGEKNDRSFHATVYGHGIESNLDRYGNIRTLGYDEINRYARERFDAIKERLGEMRARLYGSVSSCTVFPNFSFLPGQSTFRVWHPKGPNRVDLYTWTLVNKSMPADIKDMYRKGTMLTFSPGGIFEMDDGENWEYATRINEGWVTRHQPLHYGLGLDSRVEDSDMPGHIYRGSLNDANQRHFYMRWAEFMQHDNWHDLQNGPTAPPQNIVRAAE
ncbi:MULTISPECIES: SRPBCC family protein [unclassified Beijerinckia]|uniref:aromatic ring-hydroxylating oxygenase subunit alpha n=1 Tax=unclassified Beijerinckia TaxID=2638183 RepID=UPI0008970EEC|nr:MULTISPECIES: SRPBCC family protein [unclassified Beijerinckia]MDH7799041.1 ethylbenzene dioxygenase alpha subunit [Beijerinckia sp. GAS462]SED96965.1 ethylbenzene dioxygenase alpha subunit [Beijerinckia sp. 28-YEA-48]